jgi:hypothetical protein
MPARTPDECKSQCGMKTGRLRACNYCGSMHPTDLADALRAGATLSWADFKYGWPHKAYIEGVPNPHVHLLEVRSTTTCDRPPQDEVAAGLWEQYQCGYDTHTGAPKFSYRKPISETPAPARTHGKFYTEHLLDATQEERDVIERAMGLRFTFHGNTEGRVSWRAYEPETKA